MQTRKMQVMRRTLAAGLLAGAGLTLTWGTNPVSAQETMVRIAMDTAAIMNLPIFVADQKGFLAEEGIRLDYYTMAGGAASMAALLGGSVDVISAGTVSLVKVVAEGQDVVAIAGVQPDAVVSLILRDGVLPDLGRPPEVADLAGLEIGTLSRGGFADMAVRYLLIDAGLDPERDVSLIQFRSFDNLLTAGAAERVDAGLVIEPWNVVAVEQIGGWSHVVRITATDGPQVFRDSAYDTLQTTRRFIDAQPEVAAGLVRALARATELTKDEANIDTLLEVAMTAIPAADPEVLRSSILSQIGTWRIEITPDQIARSIELLVANDNAPSRIPEFHEMVATP